MALKKMDKYTGHIHQGKLCLKCLSNFDQSFAFDAPKIWNELPHDVRSAASVASFRKKLKTYLFAKAYPP